MESRINELAAKVEKLSKEMVSATKENSRLKRLLNAAENMIKEMSGGAPSGNGGAGVRELTAQVEKLKGERKLIKDKVGKMASTLEKIQKK